MVTRLTLSVSVSLYLSLSVCLSLFVSVCPSMSVCLSLSLSLPSPLPSLPLKFPRISFLKFTFANPRFLSLPAVSFIAGNSLHFALFEFRESRSTVTSHSGTELKKIGLL